MHKNIINASIEIFVPTSDLHVQIHSGRLTRLGRVGWVTSFHFISFMSLALAVFHTVRTGRDARTEYNYYRIILVNVIFQRLYFYNSRNAPIICRREFLKNGIFYCVICSLNPNFHTKFCIL